MFDHISRSCGSKVSHKQHSKYEGFIWHRKVTCYGFEETVRMAYHSPNELRELMKFPEYEEVEPPPPHKHFYRYSGWHTDKSNAGPWDQMLTFKCIDCPEDYSAYVGGRFYYKPTSVSIARWRYLEMTLDLSKVDQTWPS